jgi:EpsI family protein
MTSMTTRVLVVLAGLGAAAVAVARADRLETTPLRQPFSSFPLALGTWQGVPEPPLRPEILKVLGADDYLSRVYYREDRAGLGVFVGYWASQRQGDTIHSPQNCLPGAGWEPVADGRITMPDPRRPDAPPLTINRYIIQKGLSRQLVLYWYQSHQRIVASEYWGRFYLMVDAARLNRTDGALVRIIAPIRGEGGAAASAAEQLAAGFAQDLLPALEGFLPG